MTRTLLLSILITTIFTSCIKEKYTEPPLTVLNGRVISFNFSPSRNFSSFPNNPYDPYSAGVRIISNQSRYVFGWGRAREGNAKLYFSSTDIASGSSKLTDTDNPSTFELINNKPITVTLEFNDNAKVTDKAGFSNLEKIIVEIDEQSAVSMYLDATNEISYYKRNLAEAVKAMNTLTAKHQGLSVNASLDERE